MDFTFNTRTKLTVTDVSGLKILVSYDLRNRSLSEVIYKEKHSLRVRRLLENSLQTLTLFAENVETEFRNFRLAVHKRFLSST